ncbi:HAMP domain-containing protein/signal transduction histidine kinase/CheY-like chemotaxis protein [Caulobacter rhizosphaerae]|uniref:histidine kinase n=1 Tax=Caulobacter rhizosphaerae TaxID=2010972 RepID=A0ABU1N4K0_9CAUL|nr:HAMP domain-containing protein [Caulobacter rhizosphaerae]MDR6533365.1 HAMP domain-containing protein/signal transduction histidine kinase/CheY-like chemotaxis protein [Caulobacter rhizosphaerae]
MPAAQSKAQQRGLDNHQLLAALRAFRRGDFSVRLPTDLSGLDGELAEAFNDAVNLNDQMSKEFERLGDVVGKQGKINHRARLPGATGSWAASVDAVNNLITDMVHPTAEMARVIGATAKGDLSQTMDLENEERPLRGEFLRIGKVVNTMVGQLGSFASEVTRVAREVGTEGKLGGQAQVKGVAGTWKDLTDNVNLMAANLTGQVRNIAEVTTAVANGDLSRKITVDVKGEVLELKNTINTMVDQLNSFASEVTRVAREVGTEGKLGGQARVEGVAGTWKDLTDNVNLMAGNLTGQVRNIAEVTTAVAMGDLSKKITVDVKGEVLELKNTINVMVDQLNAFASEVTRVAREVGTEGKLGGQANVTGVGGTWKELTDNVNLMAGNLTGQVRNIAEVTTAVAMGDLSKKITVDVRGEILELKNTINTMVDQLNSFSSEVTRVAREVGTEGKLGGQAQVKGVAGTWKDLTDNVNFMAGNLTGQVRNIAEVTTAVANGDLSKKITVDVRGEILELKNTINVMVDQLNGFASEVTRVAREVGTEGKLGGQAQVKGVAGTWKDLTDNVNLMAANLTGQVRNIAEVTTAVAMGDLSKKITVDVRGEILELKNTINVMVDQLNSFSSEVTRVAREVGTEGKLGGQAQVKGVAGTWKDLTDNVNFMAANLTGQVRNIADVTTAVAKGDLSKKITVDVKGEILELKSTINVMVDQLNGFASEVTRVAREVGTEGKLGGQAQVPGVAGTWKDLTDNVNMMAANLTGQVRNIADVVTAVAQGNLKRKLTLDAKGEIASLADTINGMIETLATFADQVTNVAREVGSEGKLGGQARVPGAAGLWRDLTDNVNELAANLTTQVRAIAEVSTAVTKGDLTRSITVEASGEVAALKDNINEMIRNLKDQTLKNTEQDWLKTNLARFSRMLQGERDLSTVSNLVLSELAPLINAQHGVFYVSDHDVNGEPVLNLAASYAANPGDRPPARLRQREGLIGQCAAERQRILLTNVPSEYIKISSGLGEAAPQNIIVLPALFEGELKAVIELATFGTFNETQQAFLDQLMESIGIVLSTIAANMRTEGLLEQSQLLTAELQAQQEELKKTNDRLEQQAASLRQSEELLRSKQDELQQTNAELEDKAVLLSAQNKQVEAKNTEVEQAKAALEEKAEQLALTSKYKSEFLANMSHELRTPLNSLLILSKMLSENAQGNLSAKQVEFARNIHSAGADLLGLINDILDLSKIESGTVTLDIGEMSFASLRDQTDRTFSQLAQDKKLDFFINIDPALPRSMYTDDKRLQQVIKNLLSNAFKFTQTGSVRLTIARAEDGWASGNDHLNKAGQVLAFSVEDTGIGIPEDKQRIIFEAFQQADGTTSRKYGGTGLGLSISREITRLLGGELRVVSTPGQGSTFTLYLPLNFSPAAQPQMTQPLRPATSPVQTFRLSTTEAGSVEPAETVVDDREQIEPGDAVVLIVEDDTRFASILLSLVRDSGFKGVVTGEGSAVPSLARRFSPDAIMLDIGLPDMDGLALLDLLKRTPDTRHIPVQVISADDHGGLGLSMGAFGFTSKPVEREAVASTLEKVKKLVAETGRAPILVGGAGQAADTLRHAIGAVKVVATLSELPDEAFTDEGDCLVIDVGAGPVGPFIDTLKQRGATSGVAVLYAPEELDPEEDRRLRLAVFSGLARLARTPEQLIDHVTMSLHAPLDRLSTPAKAMIAHSRHADAVLTGLTAVVIDDDIRNIFSLASALEEYGIELRYAESGREGLELLDSLPEVDMVLVDIMMPDMDGYETMREIRARPRFSDLPVIAVTAKAMKGDRQKCIQAGASDYVSKPVDIDQLISVLRVSVQRTDAQRLAGDNIVTIHSAAAQ